MEQCEVCANTRWWRGALGCTVLPAGAIGDSGRHRFHGRCLAIAARQNQHLGVFAGALVPEDRSINKHNVFERLTDRRDERLRGFFYAHGFPSEPAPPSAFMAASSPSEPNSTVRVVGPSGSMVSQHHIGLARRVSRSCV